MDIARLLAKSLLVTTAHFVQPIPLKSFAEQPSSIDAERVTTYFKEHGPIQMQLAFSLRMDHPVAQFQTPTHPNDSNSQEQVTSNPDKKRPVHRWSRHKWAELKAKVKGVPLPTATIPQSTVLNQLASRLQQTVQLLEHEQATFVRKRSLTDQNGNAFFYDETISCILLYETTYTATIKALISTPSPHKGKASQIATLQKLLPEAKHLDKLILAFFTKYCNNLVALKAASTPIVLHNSIASILGLQDYIKIIHVCINLNHKLAAAWPVCNFTGSPEDHTSPSIRMNIYSKARSK
ncbi:MAG: hypothetical protein OXT67_03890 [Zetaproteobacteria bacterium]|nr:hypothetical protein [Zetaproteobacteria bacterium]